MIKMILAIFALISLQANEYRVIKNPNQYKIGEIIAEKGIVMDTKYDVVCISGVQYLIGTVGYTGYMSPYFDKNGSIKTCK